MSMKHLNKLALVGLISLFLISCSDEDVDELCEVPLSTAALPDIAASPSYTDNSDNPITTALAGDPIKVLVPVDADTQSVIFGFADIGSTVTTITSYVHLDAADRIVDGTAETITFAVNAPAAGTYYPVLVLCSDTVAAVNATPTLCSPAGIDSVGYVEDISDVVTTSNYARVVVTDPTPAATVIRNPDIDPTGALNSCVGISFITTS